MQSEAKGCFGRRHSGRGGVREKRMKVKKMGQMATFFLLCQKKFVSLQRLIVGTPVPYFITMIDKFKVLDIIKDTLDGTDKYLVNMKITPDSRIFVDIDGDNGINIDDCIELSRAIESKLNREEEDFELNVSSAGADSPLKMPRQYRRHVGRMLNVEPFEGEAVVGTLTEVGEEQFTIVKKATKKAAQVEMTFAFKDVKTAKVELKF